MLTSFFNKSNPINYLIVGLLIVLGYLLTITTSINQSFSLKILAEHVLYLGILVFTMLLLDFVIRKNDLNKQNTFGIAIFSGFLYLFPSIIESRDIIIANIALLLAFRRILTLDTEKNTEKKILDASLWICVATFFYSISIIFFIVLYIAIIRKSRGSYRYYFIPPIGVIAAIILYVAFTLLLNDQVDLFSLAEWKIGLDFSAYNDFSLLIPLTILLTLLIWTGSYRILKMGKVSRNERPKYILILVFLLVSIIMTLGSSTKTGAELFFIFPSISIVIANYIESKGERIFSEILLWIIIASPFVLFFAKLIS